MTLMFAKASAFNRDISSWNLSAATHVYEMFSMCPIPEEHKPKGGNNNIPPNIHEITQIL